MHLKTIPIRIEDRFIEQEDVQKIWREIRLDQTQRLVVAIDGAPGTGKSVLASQLKRVIEGEGISTGIVETDLDCLPWEERPPSSSLMEWHSETLSKEIIKNPGAEFEYTGYDPVSHRRTKTSQLYSPKNGVLIVEGLHSIEFAQKFTNQRVTALIFQISNELRESRRAERNVMQGRWKPEEVESRTAAQRDSACVYYSDLSKELAETSSAIHNTIRTFI